MCTLALLSPPRVYRRVLRTRKLIDPYRETSIRYMGYANEISEALDEFIPYWGLSVSTTYIIFDILDKGQKAFDETEKPNRFREFVFASSEALVWQMLASKIWPGGVIKTTVNIVDFIIPNDNDFLPIIIAILLIPKIVRPIDDLVDDMMEQFISKILRRIFML